MVVAFAGAARAPRDARLLQQELLDVRADDVARAAGAVVRELDELAEARRVLVERRAGVAERLERRNRRLEARQELLLGELLRPVSWLLRLMRNTMIFVAETVFPAPDSPEMTTA